MSSLNVVGMSRGISILFLWCLTFVYVLFFARKLYLHWRRSHSLDWQLLSLVTAFLGLWGSYLAGSTNMMLYLLGNQPLDVDATVRLYAWGPILAAVSITFFATGFLKNSLKWLLDGVVVLLGLVAFAMIYPDPSRIVVVNNSGGFQETNFTGTVSLVFTVMVIISVLSLIVIFTYTALSVSDLRTRLRSALIAIGGLLYGIAGLADLMIASTLDPFIILGVRLFAVFSLTVLFLGFFYPRKLEGFLLSRLNISSKG